MIVAGSVHFKSCNPHYFSSVNDVIFIGGNDYFELSLTSGGMMVFCISVKMYFDKQLA